MTGKRAPRPRARSEAKPRVYPSAIVARGASIGKGAVVGAFVFVAEGAKVGARTRIQSHTSVWAGVTLEEDVFVGPSVVFTNVKRPRSAFLRGPSWDETHVGRGASLGAGAVLVAPLRVGPFAMVGAGAVVTRDVPAHAIVAGTPAKIVGWACECGERLQRGQTTPQKGARCSVCGRQFTASRSAPR
jgi:UDP-2-acetamido-3-amino-2,3-dideoxy-glucuronate N-acetyltransferase